MKSVPPWHPQYSNILSLRLLPAMYCQGVPMYLPEDYPGSTWWVPENIEVSFEYTGTRLVAGYATYLVTAALLAAGRAFSL